MLWQHEINVIIFLFYFFFEKRAIFFHVFLSILFNFQHLFFPFSFFHLIFFEMQSIKCVVVGDG